MDIQFFQRHWVLSVLLLGLLLLWAIVEVVLRRGFAGLTPDAVIQKINHDRALCVDLREKSAYALGHIVDGLSLPASQWPDAHRRLHSPHARPIILVCESGAVSSKWCSFLRTQNFSEVYFLNGGIGAWRQEGLPLTK